MSVRVEWDCCGSNTICISFGDRWRWEDVQDAINQANALMDAAPDRVNFIIYLNKATWIPGDIQTNIQQIARHVHPNAGLVVMVLPPLYRELMYIVSALNGEMGFRYRFASSLDDARGMLNGH